MPRILLSSQSEGREPSGHPIVFTGKVKKAYEHLRSRGVMGGAVHEEGGTESALTRIDGRCRLIRSIYSKSKY